MRFSWDEAKRLQVLTRRGVDFRQAVRIFNAPVLVAEDDRFDYGETRTIATGEIDGEFFTVVYTAIGDTFRIITAWRAGRGARRRFAKSKALFAGGPEPHA